MMALSLETLKERWDHSLLCTDEAICRHSDAYKELKCLVRRINNEIIDIGQYLELARRIASLLYTMTEGKSGTIFDYFLTGMDPKKNGTAIQFRFFCTDLQNLINQIDSYRKSRRNLKLVTE
jgi:hypothetical protein